MTELPWTVKTPQVKGIVDEKDMIKKMGGVRHPMSGAGSIKADGHDKDNLYEIKTANKTHTITGDALSKLFVWAAQQEKDAVYIVKFANGMKLEGRVTRD